MDSAYAKLSRAKVHFDLLRNEVEEYNARRPITFDSPCQPHLFDHALLVVKVVARVAEEPPMHWSLIVGDILTNLRAALDHAVFGHAAARQDLNERQEQRLSFPITTSTKGWKSARHTLQPLVSEPALTFLEGVQPFNEPSAPAEWSVLAFLNQLVNRDKHRAIRAVAMRNTRTELIHTDYELERLEVSDQGFHDGDVVATATVRMPKVLPRSVSRPQYQVGNAYVVGLEVPQGPYRDVSSVIGIMHVLIEVVDRVLAGFARSVG